MLVSLFSIIVNAVADFFFKSIFSRYGVTTETPFGYGHAGLALSTSCVALVNFIALALLMRRKIERLEGRRIFSSFARIALASLALVCASHFTYSWLVQQFGEQGFRLHLLETFIPITTGVVAFYLAARILRIEEIAQAIKAVSGWRQAPGRKSADAGD